MVPGLGRLPIIGNLFRYDNRKRVKTNLMVFLRPVVLRNAEASYNLTADRYDYIRLMQGDSRVTPSELVPESQMRPSVLTPMPPRPGTAGMAPPSAAPAINESMPERWRTVVPPIPPVPPGGAPAASPGGTPPAGLVPGAASIPSRGQVIQTAPNEVVIPLNLSAPAGAAAN
jgi:general secretion pathway protein D